MRSWWQAFAGAGLRPGRGMPHSRSMRVLLALRCLQRASGLREAVREAVRWAARLAGIALVAMLGLTGPAQAAEADGGDPFQSLVWPAIQREFLGADARAVFDGRVRVRGPAFAEDPMNVPVSVSVAGLAEVRRIIVLVDRNPIRKVLEYEPLAAAPSVSFRFKLEQASPVRAAAQTADGVWHVGGTLVDSSGGGCTVSGATRADGSWSKTLGQVSARMFPAAPGDEPAPGQEAVSRAPGSARLRLRVMHPMDTGLVGGVPAFYLSRLSLQEAGGRELLRLRTFEPVSENPVFSFDFAEPPAGELWLRGSDNNGNRIEARIPAASRS